MATWAQFETEAPELAAAGKRVFRHGGIGLGYLATVTHDGRPRLAPVCPIITAGNLYLSVGAPTPKRRDLADDGRYVLHAPLGPSDEEFQVSGHASLVTDPQERQSVHAAITFTFAKEDPIFVLHIEHCLWCVWENAGQPRMRPIRRRWKDAERSVKNTT
jgi:hypothetical protein